MGYELNAWNKTSICVGEVSLEDVCHLKWNTTSEEMIALQVNIKYDWNLALLTNESALLGN